MKTTVFTGAVLLMLTNVGMAESSGDQVMGFGLAGMTPPPVESSPAIAQPQPVINLASPKQAVGRADMFGAQLFSGAFSNTSGSTFNTNYLINVGDNIQLRLWGAYQFSGTLTVDPQGNIFVPNVGPVRVAGTKNGQLQSLIQSQVRQVYRANVEVYAALEQAQPIRVYVTGFVSQPGNYGGVSSDSVLAYLDRAGGVDTERGSYVDVEVRRDGRVVQNVNLYDFLLAGQLQSFSFRNGDVIVVAPRKSSFRITGEVYNAYTFEFDRPQLTVGQALAVAKIKPSATHVSISRRQGSAYSSEYYPIAQAASVALNDGDQLSVTADRYASTIQVRIDGAHMGEHALVLPYGATLDQVLKQLKLNPLSDVSGLQLYRKSVATQQKQMLDLSLTKLEEATYSVRSSTNEEASLRAKDAQLIQQFIDRARKIQPQGQVVLNLQHPEQIILEEGDVFKIPEKTSIVMVHGEVMFANALTWQKGGTVDQYIQQVGGYTQSSDKSKILKIKPNGEALLVKGDESVQAGDQLMVLPKVATKRVEVARGISQVIYQMAIAAKVVFGL